MSIMCAIVIFRAHSEKHLNNLHCNKYLRRSEINPLNSFVTMMYVGLMAMSDNLAMNRESKVSLGLNEDGSVMQAVVSVTVSLIVMVALFYVAPMVGSSMETATSIPPGSSWNSTENADLVTGAEIWGENSNILSMAPMIVVISLIIGALTWMGMGRTGV